jgi:hypothetical protein
MVLINNRSINQLLKNCILLVIFCHQNTICFNFSEKAEKVTSLIFTYCATYLPLQTERPGVLLAFRLARQRAHQPRLWAPRGGRNFFYRTTVKNDL